MIHDVEFDLGDEVTYCPYGVSHKMYVIGKILHRDAWGRLDDRVWYKLASHPDRKHHTTICTGLCICESKYFDEWGGQTDERSW